LFSTIFIVKKYAQ